MAAALCSRSRHAGPCIIHELLLPRIDPLTTCFAAPAARRRIGPLDGGAAMARKLTREQAERLNESLRPTLGYLHRLCDRMNRVGFAPDDEVLRLAQAARDSLLELTVRLHYLSCDPG